MIQLPFAFLLAAAPVPAVPADPCLAVDKPLERARALQCDGLAFANRQEWPAAAAKFEAAAGAVTSGSAGAYWAQAGNAWLVAGDIPRATRAIEAALADPALDGLWRGEAELDKARILVAADDRAGARAAIDRALTLAAEDPLVWLLSATLARRMDDLPRAKAEIGQAVRRAPDDPSVQLEAGNVAAAAGDEAAAKLAWAEVVRLRPDSPQAKSAAAALAQFD